ncbi:hypothetical protein MUK42_05084 [Musa troglodytarum]|uniref:Uncharacterized protein n=1 Tax=Musa troglodytarum TaxID=320322 RepID=A0A9E7KFH5_9LILI|nr:hypothetical protein MUK42_05084 [Musa troglodytarum]
MRTPCWSSTGCLFPALPPPLPCGILCMVNMYPSCVFTCKGRSKLQPLMPCLHQSSIHPHLSALGYLIFLALVTLRAHHGRAHPVIRSLEALQQLPPSVSSGQLATEAHGEDEGDDEKPATESHVGGKRRMRSPPSPRIGLLIVRRVRRKAEEEDGDGEGDLCRQLKGGDTICGPTDKAMVYGTSDSGFGLQQIPWDVGRLNRENLFDDMLEENNT